MVWINIYIHVPVNLLNKILFNSVSVNNSDLYSFSFVFLIRLEASKKIYFKMSKLLDNISLENEVFRAYAFWTAVVVIKMLLMAPLTGMTRIGKKVSWTWYISKEFNIKISDKFQMIRKYYYKAITCVWSDVTMSCKLLYN